MKWVASVFKEEATTFFHVTICSQIMAGRLWSSMDMNHVFNIVTDANLYSKFHILSLLKRQLNVESKTIPWISLTPNPKPPSSTSSALLQGDRSNIRITGLGIFLVVGLEVAVPTIRISYKISVSQMSPIICEMMTYR
jgi:hypothetical protein